jgi:hypothetical protein
VIALKYIEKFIMEVDALIGGKHKSNIFNNRSFHRIFLAAIVVASKFLQDRTYTNNFYARLGGVSVGELWELEHQFLMIMKLDLDVNLREFNDYCANLVEQYRIRRAQEEEATRAKESSAPREETPMSEASAVTR